MNHSSQDVHRKGRGYQALNRDGPISHTVQHRDNFPPITFRQSFSWLRSIEESKHDLELISTLISYQVQRR